MLKKRFGEFIQVLELHEKSIGFLVFIIGHGRVREQKDEINIEEKMPGTFRVDVSERAN